MEINEFGQLIRWNKFFTCFLL